MLIKYYMSVLNIETMDEITETNIHKQYRNIARKCHPDKTKDNNSEYFIELTEAKRSLLEFVNAKNYKNVIDNDNNEWWEWINTYIINNETNDIKLKNNITDKFREMISNTAIKLFDTMGNHNMLRTYELFLKYKEHICLDDKTLENLKNKIIESTQVIILEPSLNDLFVSNVFKLNYNNENYLIPLWHNELYFDTNTKNTQGSELIVRCLPILEKGIWLSSNNDVHKCIRISLDSIKCLSNNVDDVENNYNKTVVNICDNFFNVYHSRLLLVSRQNVIFKGKGIPRINSLDLYDDNDKSDIIIHIELTL